MVINEISQLVSSVGFPIAMCIVMGFFIKYTTDTHREDLQLMQQNHKETASRLANSIEENTAVIEELSGKINFGMNGGVQDEK